MTNTPKTQAPADTMVPWIRVATGGHIDMHELCPKCFWPQLYRVREDKTPVAMFCGTSMCERWLIETRIGGKAESPPAADPVRLGCGKAVGHGDPAYAPCVLDAGHTGEHSAAADESGATREEKCHECSHVHQGVYCNFNMRSHGTHLCRCSARPLPPPTPEPGRGEVSEGRRGGKIDWEAGIWSLARSLESGRQFSALQAEQHDRWAEEAIERVRRALHTAEEARRLAEQERDEEARLRALTISAREGLRAEVERLQGELAGLRDKIQKALWTPYMGDQSWRRLMRAALAPQEGAEPKDKP